MKKQKKDIKRVNKKFPDIKRDIRMFLLSEEGKVDKSKVIIGTITLAGLFAITSNIQAQHCNSHTQYCGHNSFGYWGNHVNWFGNYAGRGVHNSTTPWCHNSHGSHCSHGSHGQW